MVTSERLMTQWTKQQLQCLQTLGVPLYVRKESTSVSTASDTPHQDTEQSGAAYFYKLGAWTFKFPTQLPVDLFPWLKDLAAYCNEQPSEVKPVDNYLDASAYNKAQLSADEKKALWQRMQQWLN